MNFDIQKIPGVYVIRCLANNATYVGSAKKLGVRVQSHFAELVSSRKNMPLFLKDWDTYGSAQFIMLVSYVSGKKLYDWEEWLTVFFNAMEEDGGYNKKIGNRRWSPCARIRDTERKLKKSGKFLPLPYIDSKSRIHPGYARTFCQTNFQIGDEIKSLKAFWRTHSPISDDGFDNEFIVLQVRLPDAKQLNTDAARTLGKKRSFDLELAGLIPVQALSSLDAQVSILSLVGS